MYDYGKCHICNAPMEEKHIQQDFWVKNRLVVIENVPVGICNQCGEKIVKAKVGEQILELLNNKTLIDQAPKISVPLIKYNEEKVAV